MEKEYHLYNEGHSMLILKLYCFAHTLHQFKGCFQFNSDYLQFSGLYVLKSENVDSITELVFGSYKRVFW